MSAETLLLFAVALGIGWAIGRRSVSVQPPACPPPPAPVEDPDEEFPDLPTTSPGPEKPGNVYEFWRAGCASCAVGVCVQHQRGG